MGGLISVNYLLGQQEQLAGCALSGPALATELQPGALQLFAIKLLSFFAPRVGALQLDADGVSRDPAEVAKYLSDPLVYTGKLSARLLAELFRAMQSAEEGARRITIPLLIMHGADDQMTAPSGSRTLHESAASSDKTLKIYPGLYHEIFNEPERLEVMTELGDWLDRLIG